MPRSYAQICGIARALDVVGDRWTLLVVREFVLGPRRYSDVLDSLDGITTNLLADRLARLTAACVLERRELPAPARAEGYALTDLGRRLEPALLALGAFGAALPLADDVSYRTDARWAMLSMRRRFRGARMDLDLDVRVDAARFRATAAAGEALRVVDGGGVGSCATLELAGPALARWLGGAALSDLEADGDARLTGSRAQLRAFARAVELGY
ncbi:MAG: helix-turn-helix domain-containing protein [Planctomycetota bacterium]